MASSGLSGYESVHNSHLKTVLALRGRSVSDSESPLREVQPTGRMSPVGTDLAGPKEQAIGIFFEREPSLGFSGVNLHV